MKKLSEATYNERLFSTHLRGRLHLARFRWLRRAVLRHRCESRHVLELGCFDGKAVEYLPCPPDLYEGFDADWEGGLALARTRWASHPQYTFKYCTRPDQLRTESKFDISIVMETLEHVPPETVDPYLRRLSERTRQCIFVTVPNEKGLVFLLKHMAKRFTGDTEVYRIAEVVNATLGRMHKVERREHKGFDYADAIAAVSRHFEVVEVSGYPFPMLPLALNFGVCIVGRRKPSAGRSGQPELAP